MPKKSVNSDEAMESQPSIHPAIPVLYADRIVNMGLGPAVSRLTLGVDGGNNVVMPVTQIVIPTPALFEAVEFMARHLESDEAKMHIIEALEQFKAKLASSG